MTIYPVTFDDDLGYPLDSDTVATAEALSRTIGDYFNGQKVRIINDNSPAAISIGGIISTRAGGGETISTLVSEKCQSRLVEKIQKSENMTLPMVLVAPKSKMDDFKMQITKVLVEALGPIAFTMKAPMEI